MADIIADIDELRRIAEAAGRKRADTDRRLAGAEGKRDAVAADLQSEFGVGTPEAARELAGRAEGKLAARLTEARAQLAQAGVQQ